MDVKNLILVTNQNTYISDVAKRKTEENLVKSRSHLYILKETIEKLEKILNGEIKRGMSPEVILLKYP